MYKMCSKQSKQSKFVWGYFSPNEQEINNFQGTSLTGVQKLMGNTLCHFFQ